MSCDVWMALCVHAWMGKMILYQKKREKKKTVTSPNVFSQVFSRYVLVPLDVRVFPFLKCAFLLEWKLIISQIAG